MNIRVTQIDGKLPNLALMRLSRWHKERGDDVYFTSSVERGLMEPEYGAVYGSCIFSYSADRLYRFMMAFPEAIVGGTGSGNPAEVESIIGESELDYSHSESLDYSLYPNFKASIGFTQRGCRLKCGFCCVPKKEGENRDAASVWGIWREDYPKHLHLLDNDFFGQPNWRPKVRTIVDNKFKVCLNQGINVRLIDDESAEALSTMEYRDDQFQQRRLYTAWDNIGHERIFFDGIDRLERVGIKPSNIMAYMLIGYDPAETMERIFYRFDKMVFRGIKPYPMVYDRTRKELREFQRWVITGLYRAIPFSEYRVSYKSSPSSSQMSLIEVI